MMILSIGNVCENNTSGKTSANQTRNRKSFMGVKGLAKTILFTGAVHNA
jgi:hypothetical protein